jgi:hypothetical protein
MIEATTGYYNTKHLSSVEDKRQASISATAMPIRVVPWWKEPTKDQWFAYMAAWLGWTLDAFDFTVFLLVMLPISQEFGLPLTAGASIGAPWC